MNQEEKQLLLADLCTRLAFHCRVFYEYVDDLDNKTYGYSLTLNTWCIDEFNADKAVVKPYLRPMSSMTEEEKEEISQKLNYEFYVDEDAALCAEDERHRIRLDLIEVYIDWLNKNHFDYRGFIEKGLAIEAAEGMYNLKGE